MLSSELIAQIKVESISPKKDKTKENKKPGKCQYIFFFFLADF